MKIQTVDFTKEITKKRKRYKKLLKRNLRENRYTYHSANVVLTKDYNWTILYKSREGGICKVVSFNGKFLNAYEFNH